LWTATQKTKAGSHKQRSVETVRSLLIESALVSIFHCRPEVSLEHEVEGPLAADEGQSQEEDRRASSRYSIIQYAHADLELIR
jgi:hypothetical protein